MRKYLLFLLILTLKTTLSFSQGASREKWHNSEAPNYIDNVNLHYPYSDQETSISSTNIIPIPTPNAYVYLIDFYGEGRIVDHNLVSGFKNAYNINHQYQLVSNGPDKDRGIPNRIPVPGYYDDLQLSRYILADRVSNITLMGAPILQNTAQEMARMIRKDGMGKIIIYGFSDSDPEVVILERELKKIDFYYAEHSFLEPPFNEIKGFSNSPRVYKSKKISIVGEKVFWSLNPKLDYGVSEDDMVTLDFGKLLRINADLSGGIKGKINKPGGRISVEVYAYDKNESNGIQKMLGISLGSARDKLVYGAYSDITSIDEFVEKTNRVPYAFLFDRYTGKTEVLGETDSNNVKMLGATSRSGWDNSLCQYAYLRGLIWLGWKVGIFYFYGSPEVREPLCQKVITELQSGKQPVLVKVTIQDATLYEFKIPGVTGNNIVNFNVEEKTNEYKIIKKLKIIVLESPYDSRDAAFYKEKIGNYVREMNSYYTAKTGNIKNARIKAEIGNPRFFFKNVDLYIKKATAERYNFEIPIYKKKYEHEAMVDANDDETMLLIYVHSLVKYYPSKPSERVIRGTSLNGNAVISNQDYTVFSYSRMFNDDPEVYGTPGSTLAHEFGHYFGLLHPFEGGCIQARGGDMVLDTPPAEGALWYLNDPGGPNERGINNPCENLPSCYGQIRQVENIMDYGPCRWLFTKGQEELMIRRLNTKPSLFQNLFFNDVSIDPNQIYINIYDQRDRGDAEARQKRDVVNSDFFIRMLYPNFQIGYYNLEIVSDKPEKATIRIFDIHSNQLYDESITVEEGLNHFPVKPDFFKEGGLYLLTYSSDAGRLETIKFLGI